MQVMKKVMNRKGITIALLLIVTLLCVGGSLAYFSDTAKAEIEVSVANAVDYDYSLAGSINDKTEVTITSLGDEVFIVLTETNNEGRDLFSAVTLTSDWSGETDLSRVTFKDVATGTNLTSNLVDGKLVLEFPSGKVPANSSVTHRIQVILDEAGNGTIAPGDTIVQDTLNFTAESKVSEVKDSWSETVGPVELKLHTSLKYPTKLEVAANSNHRDAYLVGDDFDSTDLILTVTYNTGDTAEITYKPSEDAYYIDKNNGKGKVVLTDTDFGLSNILDLKQIRIGSATIDHTKGGTGAYREGPYNETFIYLAEADEYKVYGVDPYDGEEYINFYSVEEFNNWYVNSPYHTLTLNDPSDITKGGSAVYLYEKTFTYSYDDDWNEYIFIWEDGTTNYYSPSTFYDWYVNNSDYVLYPNDAPEYEENGSYPHAAYTEYGTTVECDITITVGNAIMQAWTAEFNGEGYYVPETDFHKYYRDITSVEFLKEYNLPANFDTTAGYGPWDVSQDKDGSVMAYIVTDNGGLDVKICANVGKTHKVIANKNSETVFAGFRNMTEFDGTNLDTANAENMQGMFGCCSYITNMDLSTWNTANVTDMHEMFQQCYNLTDLNLSNWNVSNVLDMCNMFEGDTVLSNLNISNWNPESATNFEYMFRGCESLESLDLSTWNTANAINLTAMFLECTSLTSVNVTDWNVSNVEYTRSMFADCQNLSSIDISKWNCAHLFDNEAMFKNCYELTELTIPASMEKIDAYFAYGCGKLTEITFLHTAADALTISSSNTFYVSGPYNADNLLKTYVHTNNDTIKDIVYAHGWKNENRTLLFDVNFVQTEGGTLTGDVENQQEWAEDNLTMEVTATPEDGYKLDKYNITYTAGGVEQIVEATDLSTFEMPWTEITITPVWKVAKVPIKLEVADASNHRDAYLVGDDFDSTDLILTVTYDDASTAEITYKPSEDAYYIDKGDGKGKVALTNTDFVLSNISNLAQIIFETIYDTPDYTLGGSGTDYFGEFTFTFDSTSDGYIIIYKGESYEKRISIVDFYSDYVKNDNITLNPNDISSGSSVTTKISGTYPHASYTENSKTVECDVEITCGNVIMQAWTEDAISDFHVYKKAVTNAVTEVQFVKTYRLPDGFDSAAGYGPWDVSQDKDQSVMAYMVGSKVYICANVGVETKVKANVDSSYAFFDFRSLSEFDGKNLDTSNAKTMSYMFGLKPNFGWESLSEVSTDDISLTNCYDLSTWDVSNVTDMSYMFNLNMNVSTIKFENWNVSNVKDMTSMFALTKITEIDVSSWNTVSVESMSSMFNGCESLITLNISEWNVSNVNNMYEMFANCSLLESIDISKWNCSSVTNNIRMFSYCNKFTELTIPASMSHLDQGFAWYCDKLTNITFLHTASDDLTTGSVIFKVEYPYTADNLLKTTVVTNNDTIKDIVYAYSWKYDNRTLLYDVNFVQTEGGTLTGDVTDQQEWAEDNLSMNVTATPDADYVLDRYLITYNENGTEKFVETLDLSTFEMPWAEVTVTPQWKISKIPVKLEVTIAPDETYYVPGEDYNATGVEFTVTYDDDSTSTIIYKPSEDAYYIDKHNGKGYKLLSDTDFVMTNITNLKEVYTYTPKIDYKKGGTLTSGNGDTITFVYNEGTGEYELTFSNGNTYSYDESYFLSYYAEADGYTVTPNEPPVETKVGTLPHAAYTENAVTVECDVVIKVAAPILKNTYGYQTSNCSLLDKTDLLSYLENDTITEVEFVESFDGLDKTSMDYADVSDKQNGSVLAWVDGNTLYVGGKTGVYANTQMTGLFSHTFRDGYHYYYDDVTSIDVTHLKVIGENDDGYPVTTDISSAFDGCTALTSITGLENWNTASITNMSGLFKKTALTKVSGVKDWDTGNVEYLSSMFLEAKSLTNVSELANWDVSSVKDMSSMFSDCTELTTAPIGNWNCASLGNDWQYNNDSMFSGCTKLNNLVIPASMGYIGDSFAQDCSSLVNITFNHGPSDTLTFTDSDYWLYLPFYIGKAADDPYIKTYITLPNDVNGAVKDKIYAYNWDMNNRSLPFDVTVKPADGITFNENTTGLTAWSQYPTDLTFTFTLADSYEFSNWKVEYTDFDGNAQTVEVAKDDLKSFVMPYADITITPVVAPPPIMQSWVEGATTDFHANKSTITSVTFLDTYSLPDGFDTTAGNGPWDVSDAKNGSVMAYQVGTDVYICSNVGKPAKVIANVNSSCVFYNFKTMTKFDGTNLDTSRVNNMIAMFQNCSKLTSLDGLATWETHSVSLFGNEYANRAGMFAGCTLLADIDGISNWDTVSATSMARMFNGCALTNVDALEKWNTENVTNMDSMFLACGNLSDINGLANWNVKNVTEMAQMFYSTALANVDALASWNTGAVSSMQSMFCYCKSLKNIDGLAKWNTGSVTSIASMFQSCSNLSNIDGLANWNTENVTKMESLFSGCSNLSNVNALKDWNASSVTTTEYMFNNCSNLSNIDGLATWNTENITKMGSMFSGCSKLSNVNALKDWNTGSVTSIGGMFINCSNLSNIDGLANWNTEKITNMGTVFYGCSSLSNVNALKDWTTSSVSTIERIFYGCSGLSNIDGLTNWNTEKVTTMSRMFYGCSSLSNVNALKDWSTGSVTTIEGMFYGCNMLSNIDGLANWNTEKITNMGTVFYGCGNLSNVNGLVNWNTKKVTRMNGMFTNCTNLTILDLSGWNTSNITNMYNMFGGTTNLATIYVGDGWNTDKVTSSKDMFTNCTSLVGGNGTAYDSTKVDKTYARVDTAETPGYFTLKPATVNLQLDLNGGEVVE